MKKILAVNFFGMMLMSAVWAQQPDDLTVSKQEGGQAGLWQTKSGSLNAVAGEAAKAADQARSKKVNLFNRTMRPLSSYNLTPLEDGIHDPGNESVKKLKSLRVDYANLPRDKLGIRVDWVAALASGKISPLWDRVDADAERMVMDMDILRIPRGSMRDVVFPHKQHTEWLACSSCHPAIFVPQKGANQISMALIMSGQKCGVCHGKVAFPPSECSKCHSRNKVVHQP